VREQAIENHGVIGDLRTVALVGMNGVIDFMCFPEFDSPSVFAALLDAEKGGQFRLSPEAEDCTQKQIYLPDSNILLTRFLFSDGMAEVSDFMTVGLGDRRALVRRAKSVRGHFRIRMGCAPRFNYARSPHRVEQRSEHEILFHSEGDDQTTLLLRSTAPMRVENGDAGAEVDLESGHSVAYVLEEVLPGTAANPPVRVFVPHAFKSTNDFWRRWVAQSTYRGRWRSAVNRSALVLKLLTSAKHGSMVAAPTFGLPERFGGARNWDYRYTWIRDASFTLYGLNRLGYTAEAGAFMNWIEARCGELDPDSPLRIMYRLDGRHEIPEEALPHLSGHNGSTPVRIGNSAQNQLQLDIYGELMDAVYLQDKFGDPISYDLWDNLVRLLNWLCDHWRDPDDGIWEVRGGAREFLHSRVMCWVAVDRAIRIVRRRSFPAPFDRWRETRDAITKDIFTRFWDPARKTFVQHVGAKTTDAATLLMPLMKFIGPTDPRWLSTMRAIQHDLVEDALVFRYRPDKAAPDGLLGEEGTFSMCSFWHVEALARSHDVDKARFLFEKVLGYSNHLGLYSEELGPRGEHLGNFPQAFTHIALISAAYCLDRAMDAAGRPQ
jgi:GH15 family glucan-1,4-alpha-glucosidase